MSKRGKTMKRKDKGDNDRGMSLLVCDYDDKMSEFNDK